MRTKSKKEELDLQPLDQFFSKAIKITDQIRSQMKRVAFDVFQMGDSTPENLWKVESTADGDYLVALYDDDSFASMPAKQASTNPKSPWEVILKTASNELNVFYKGTPIHRFSHPEAETISSFLAAKLADNQSFRQAFLQEIPQARQTEILKLYPELS